MAKTSNIAFALGGLAGNNAHGAGFLQAALHKGAKPGMISCTSGQILWVHRYLEARESGRKHADGWALKDELEEDIGKLQPYREPNADFATLLLFGKGGVYRPAYAEYARDWAENTLQVMDDIRTGWPRIFGMHELLRLFPCRLLVPEFPQDFFASIAHAFNGETEIGIVFNSYNPADGKEYVYLNDAARTMLEGKSQGSRSYAPGERSPLTPVDGDRGVTREYASITPQAVQDALWLYQYGFDRGTDRFLDGAYFRQIMLSELTHAHKIYVVRPISRRWLGPMPHNYPDLEDLKTEVWLDGTYAAERQMIELINHFLSQRKIAGDVKNHYHHIQVKEVPLDSPRGYFDYLFEDLKVFDKAYQRSMQVL